MDAYFDTVIILKLYVQEATSPDALRLPNECPTPYLLTPWPEIEARTALRLKAFRKEITAALHGKRAGDRSCFLHDPKAADGHSASLINRNRSAYSSTALNCGNCFCTLDGDRKRYPTLASISIAVSLKESPAAMTL